MQLRDCAGTISGFAWKSRRAALGSLAEQQRLVQPEKARNRRPRDVGVEDADAFVHAPQAPPRSAPLTSDFPTPPLPDMIGDDGAERSRGG